MIVVLFFFYIICGTCYLRSDEKRTQDRISCDKLGYVCP